MAPSRTSSHDWLATGTRKHAYFDPAQFDHRTALEAFSAAGLGPMKAMALSQMEMVTLASRRTQAYMTIPSRLARCRSSQDLVGEQMLFWQTAMEQYQESASRLFQAWADVWGFQAFAPPTASERPGKSADHNDKAGHSAGLIHLPTAARPRGGSAPSSRGNADRPHRGG